MFLLAVYIIYNIVYICIRYIYLVYVALLDFFRSVTGIKTKEKLRKHTYTGQKKAQKFENKSGIGTSLYILLLL